MTERHLHACILLVIFTLLGAASTIASTTVTTQGSAYDGALREHRSDLDGRIIDTVIIDNRDVYDTDSAHYDKFIFRLANSLHATTRTSVIRRELLLEKGDRYSQVLAEETARNIRTRLTIFDAWIEASLLENGHVQMKVVTIDTWSIEAGVEVRKEGADNKARFTLKDRNLLGYGQYLSLDYNTSSRVEDYITTRFLERRVLGQPIWFDIVYSTDPRNKFVGSELLHPFYNRDQKFSYGLFGWDLSGRRDVYRGNRLIARSGFNGDELEYFGHYRVGSYYKKMTYRLEGRYVYQQSRNREFFSSDPEDIEEANNAFPDDSLYHEGAVGVTYTNVNFVKLRRIDGFDVTEDFVIGRGISLTFGHAFNANTSIYHRGRFDYGYVSYRNHQLFGLGLEGSLWWYEGSRLRERLRFRAYYYNRTTEFLTIAGRLAYDADSRADESNPLVLGGTTGVRGLDEFYATGNRRLAVNLEARSRPQLEILSVLFAGAAFLDFGRTYDYGEEFSVHGMTAAIGAGLRMSLERASAEGILRFDFAYSEQAGWGLSISTGQYFSAPKAVFP